MKAIISFANNKGNYYQALSRLADSVKDNFDGEFMAFMGEASIGAPWHFVNPYAFKIYAFLKAREMGYTQVLYLDSSVYAVANVQPIFDLIEKDGYFMQEAGHYVQEWTSPSVLRAYEVQPEPKLTMYSAGITGLNFNNPDAVAFFDDWSKGMLAGHFKGDWKTHRHDMSVASILAHKYGFKYQSGNEYVQYWSEQHPEPKNETICLMLRGM